jgi:hypothetical protein
MTSATSGAEDPTSEDEEKEDDSAGRMDEFGQGPKRAVAEAVARLLRIQRSMQSNNIESSSKRPVARAKCSYKCYALRPVPRWRPRP